jgi:hypothetical protein
MVWFKQRSILSQKAFSASYYMPPDLIFGRAVGHAFS